MTTTDLANFLTVLVVVIAASTLWYILHHPDRSSREYFAGLAWRLISAGSVAIPVTWITGSLQYGWLATLLGAATYVFIYFAYPAEK